MDIVVDESTGLNETSLYDEPDRPDSPLLDGSFDNQCGVDTLRSSAVQRERDGDYVGARLCTVREGASATREYPHSEAGRSPYNFHIIGLPYGAARVVLIVEMEPGSTSCRAIRTNYTRRGPAARRSRSAARILGANRQAPHRAVFLPDRRRDVVA
jgi:hypothetical protein